MRMPPAAPALLAEPARSAGQGGRAAVSDIQRRLAPSCARAEPRQRPVKPRWAALTAAGVFAPPGTTLAEVVRVAGTRGTVAGGGEAATGAVGLAHEAVRTWTGW